MVRSRLQRRQSPYFLVQMKLIHRFGYYLGGFAIGLVFLAFFLSGKKASCDYGPEARVLKNISTKTHEYSPTVLRKINEFNLDSLTVANVLRNGEVNFGDSEIVRDSCSTYVIEGEHEEKNLVLRVVNCEEIATISEMLLKE